MMERDTRIAAVVCRCPVGQTKRNLERIRYWVEQARKKGAALVCFPELNITGYSNREEIAGHAISAHGSEINTLVRLAVDQQVVLLVGFAEKNGEGTIYASHMVITPQGRTGIYRKLHLAPPETDQFSPAMPCRYSTGQGFDSASSYATMPISPNSPHEWQKPMPT
jgi:predicted amidohydrolase